MEQASLRALADCGLTVADVDGLAAAATQLPMASVSLGEALGIDPRWTDSTQIGGGSPIAHLDHARAAIAAGLCEVVLIAYGSTQRSVGRAQRVAAGDRPLRAALPPAAARRGLRAGGRAATCTSSARRREQLAEVAVAARRLGARPAARVVEGPADRRRRARRAARLRPVRACATAAW